MLQIINLDGDYDFGDFPVMHDVEGGTWRVLEGKKTEENSGGKNENESWLSKQVNLSARNETSWSVSWNETIILRKNYYNCSVMKNVPMTKDVQDPNRKIAYPANTSDFLGKGKTK